MNTKTFVKLTDDILFKEALAHKDNRYFLEYFLETFLFLDKGSLKDKLNVEYESIFTNKRYGEKPMRGDIVVRYDNYKINIECYSTLNNKSISKYNHYIMKVYSDIDEGKDYNIDTKVKQINIVDGVGNKNLPDSVCSEYVLKDKKTGFELDQYQTFTIYYYRVDLVQNNDYNIDEENKDIIRFLKFIGAKSEKMRIKACEGDEKMLKFNKWLLNYVNDREYKRKMGKWAEQIEREKIHDEGHKEGFAAGRKQGIKQGAKNNSFYNVPIGVDTL